MAISWLGARDEDAVVVFMEEEVCPGSWELCIAQISITELVGIDNSY